MADVVTPAQQFVALLALSEPDSPDPRVRAEQIARDMFSQYDAIAVFATALRVQMELVVMMAEETGMDRTEVLARLGQWAATYEGVPPADFR